MADDSSSLEDWEDDDPQTPNTNSNSISSSTGSTMRTSSPPTLRPSNTKDNNNNNNNQLRSSSSSVGTTIPSTPPPPAPQNPLSSSGGGGGGGTSNTSSGTGTPMCPPPQHQPPSFTSTATASTPASAPKQQQGSTGGSYSFWSRQSSAAAKQQEEERLRIEEEKRLQEYNALLAEANNSSFSDIESLKLVYVSGVDLCGRPIVVIVAAHIPPQIEHHRLLLYFLRIMDPIVVGDYVLVYVHTNASMDNNPGVAWMKKCYQLFRRGYKKNLKMLYLVEPTFFIKGIFKLFQPFISAKFYHKIIYIERLQDIYKHMSPKQFVLPDDIIALMPPDLSITNPVAKPLLFGVPLDVVMTYPMNENKEVPLIVIDAYDCVLEQGLQTQGVFRVSGSGKRVKEIINIYNTGSQVDLHKEDIHDVAAVLKHFIRDLPDPLCCYDLYQEWLNCAGASGKEEVLQRISAVLTKLPKINFTILARVIYLLKIISESPETSMSANNLAIVWAPNLMRAPNETMQTVLYDASKTNQVVAVMISHYDALFLRD